MIPITHWIYTCLVWVRFRESMEVVILDKIRGKPELPFQIPLGEFTEKSDPPWDSVLSLSFQRKLSQGERAE